MRQFVETHDNLEPQTSSPIFQLGRFGIGNKRGPVRYSGSIHDPATPVQLALTGLPGISAIKVNKTSALTISAIWNGVLQISQDFGAFSKHVYAETKGVKQKIDHPLNALLAQPNKIQTGPVFFESLMMNYQLRGNGLAYIKKDKHGRINENSELIILDPDRTKVRISKKGNIFYDSFTMYGLDKEIEYKGLRTDEVIHVPNLSYGGIWGTDIVQQFSESLGLAKSQEAYNNELYLNGGSPQMVLSYPGKLPADASKEINEKLQRDHAGYGKHHRAFIMGDGGTVQQTTFNPEQLSFLTSRVFQVEEVARMINMPLHKIKSMKASTNNNIEQQSKEYYQDTQQPIITKFEAEINKKILGTSVDSSNSVEWDMDDTMRADVKTKFTAYGQAATFQFMTTNEIRAKLGLAPITGGDKFIDFQSPANSPKDEKNENTD